MMSYARSFYMTLLLRLRTETIMSVKMVRLRIGWGSRMNGRCEDDLALSLLVRLKGVD